MSSRLEEQAPAAAQGSIDLTADANVSYWTQTLGISELDLRKAVAEVGTEVTAVQGFMAQQAPSTS
ncbi:DUF3606 domain-containing protein [Methylibium rhizosphaerae]|jgi:hypothetical protein|uniref:DUF3606 domain-containing protein n=1 Tax=Methylibium rhizosphaerae TaxID=2570323 RepID=UPI001127DA76|nr:DUF3606 domain-containing protein [Methylibium rhizosphaerae]